MEHLAQDVRGLFWRGSEFPSSQRYAPEGSVAGTLKITTSGAISLELDGLLSNEVPSLADLLTRDHGSSDLGISGILKDRDSSRVILKGAWQVASSISTNGISHKTYKATFCLVGSIRFDDPSQKLELTALEFSLNGLEEWVESDAISAGWEKESKAPAVNTGKIAPKTYVLDEGFLTVRREYAISQSGRRTEIRIEPRNSIQWKFNEGLQLKEAVERYKVLTDFLLLVTGSNVMLDWPIFTIGQSSSQCYFERQASSGKPPQWTDLPTDYPRMEASFGDLFGNWICSREKYGPGFYLFLGNRRGLKMYAEHKFASLIWGLEALHRGNPVGSTNDALQKKVDRILGKITIEKDRRWLESRLKHASEPSLETRLFELYVELPVEFEERSLRTFCKECADRRNDISHFGGQRQKDSYSEFVSRIALLSHVTDFLYQMLLFKRIGMNDELIRANFFDRPNSFATRKNLRLAGLHLIVRPAAEST